RRHEPMAEQQLTMVTKEDQEFYKENGYWIGPVLFNDEEVEEMRKAHERIWAKDYDGDGFPLTDWIPNGNPTQLRKIDNAWWINDVIRSVVTSPKLGRVAAELLDTDEIRLWYDQVIYKPGSPDVAESSKANIGWHQD